MQQHNPRQQSAHVHREAVFLHVEALQKLAHLAKVAKLLARNVFAPEPVDGLHGALEGVPKVAHVGKRHQEAEHLPEPHEEATEDEHRDDRAGHAEYAELEVLNVS